MSGTILTAAADLEQIPGFRPLFGGEELKRANAALAGSAVTGILQAYLDAGSQEAGQGREHSHAHASSRGSDVGTAAASAGGLLPSRTSSGGVGQHSQPHQLLRSSSSSTADPLEIAARELGHAARLYQEQYERATIAAAAAEHEVASGAAGEQGSTALQGIAVAGTAGAPGGAPPEGLDYDSLYGHGLVLQELAARAAPGSKDHVAHLRLACQRYEEALVLRPGAHSALYNWGVALSDLARAARASDPAAARACLEAAAARYAAALAVHPENPQALNNWGLVLQELSGEARERSERDTLLRHALAKFRHAVRLRPDFDRGCYNLGTVCYAYACTLQGEVAMLAKGGPNSPTGAAATAEAEARSLFTASAQYICLALALRPTKDVYRKSLSVVKQLLPLPFLRAGYLTAPVPSTQGSHKEVWRRDWFVLDHDSLRSASGAEGSLTTRGPTGVLVSPGAAPAHVEPMAPQGLVLPLGDVQGVVRAEDPSLPEGAALWVRLRSDPQGLHLIADDEDAADAWADALLLCAYIVQSRGVEALADALQPHHSTHHHHH